MTNYQKLTEGGPEAYLAALNKIGWFDLSQNLEFEVKDIIEAVEDNTQLVSGIGHLFVEEGHYAGSEALDEFTEHMLRLNSLAKLVWEVKESEEGVFEVTIQTKQKTFNHIIRHDDEDPLRPMFIEEFINSVLEDVGAQDRFYRLAYINDGLLYTLIPDQYYQAALQEGIIPGDRNFRLQIT